MSRSKADTTDNPLFGRFDDLLKTALHVPAETDLGNFWGDRKKLTFADFFCGIGGFHAAAKELGHLECVFACDIDEDCRTTYAHNFKLKPESDIRRIAVENIPAHDILCAGFPCQPFSIIGDRGGFADARGTLFFDLARILEAKRPQAFVLENVKQLVSHNKGKTLQRILEILRNFYSFVDFRVLNALHFGLPQKRERVLIVGFNGEIEGFPWPTRRLPMIPLSEILEEKPDKKHFVSDRIKRARQVAHKAKITPSIWHENKAGNISSHPFS